MAVDGNRLAQVFIWKEGSAPDLRYARQILSVVNPEASRAIDWDNPPIHLFAVEPPWPGDQWARAISDLQTISYRTGGPNLTDTTRFDLAGWQGTDQRTRDHIFVVVAYRRAVTEIETPAADFQGQGLPAPSRTGQRGVGGPQPAVPQVPYYPQQPTGPLAWPPSEQPVPESYVYNPMLGGAMSTSGDMAATVAAHSAFLEGYKPYYTGFGPRLAAGLIDFFFMSLLQVITIVVAVITASPQPPPDFPAWIARYGPLALLAILIFGAYHVVQWSTWGQTIGKKLMGIKVVGADGQSPGWGRSVLRFVGYIFSISLGGWGVVMVALDLRHQGLHDKIAETFVVPEKAQVPAPAGLPGYTGFNPPQAARPVPQQEALPQPQTGQLPALGMANLAGDTAYNPIQISMSEASRNEQRTPGDRTDPTDRTASTPQPGGPGHQNGLQRGGMPMRDMGETTIPNLSEVLASGPLAEGIVSQTAARNAAAAQNEQAASNTVRARTLFKEGLAQMEGGVLPSSRGYNVEPIAARAAANLFRQAVELVPGSVVYRHFYAIALRYSEGFEVAIPELRRVLEQDPTHYEARQQVAYGPRWHDAFAYPAWVSPAPVNPGETLPAAIRGLLPPGQQPATRLVLLREGGTKIAAFLSRTPRQGWTRLPTPEMDARLSLFLSRTPYGPIIALYIVVDDDAENPYIGETFLNPHDPGQPHEDACQLGQNMLEQIARQDRTYLIFADEHDRLLLSRRLVFDAATQVSTARMLYEVQSLPPQVMDQERFRQAAQWHMEHFSLDQVKG